MKEINETDPDTTAQWWAEKCAHIARMMKITGAEKLEISLKENGKYTFDITPENDKNHER